MRLIITGASGFLGSHLVKSASARGHSIVPVVRQVDERSPERAVPISALLSNPEVVGRADVIIHAAAVRHRYGVDAAEYRRSNVDLVASLLHTLSGRVGRFVLVSSVGVYGFSSRLPISEGHPFAPKTIYSHTKVEAEKIVRELSGSCDMEFTILRPTIIYGPGDRWGMMNKMVGMMKAGTYRVVGNGRNTLHHAFVSDVVDAILLAASHPGARGEDFIIAGPEPTTLGALSALVAKTVGLRVPRLHVPLAVARSAATLVDIAAYRGLAWRTREPPINNEKLDVMTRSISFDTAKARERLGFVAQFGYERGVAEALRATGGAVP